LLKIAFHASATPSPFLIDLPPLPFCNNTFIFIVCIDSLRGWISSISVPVGFKLLSPSPLVSIQNLWHVTVHVVHVPPVPGVPVHEVGILLMIQSFFVVIHPGN
jgi:hypothetical protein